MFKNESTNKLMSMAVVAMMMLCAFGACLGGMSDANTGDSATDPYIINIRNGQTFEYTPTVNLTGASIAVDDENTTAAAAQIDWTNGKLTYAPQNVTSGTSTIIALKATWYSGANQTGLTQTAMQYIKFNVFNQTVINIDGTESMENTNNDALAAIVGNDESVFNALDYEITKGSSPSSATVAYGTFTKASATGSETSGLFSFNETTGKLTQSTEATANDIGVWSATVTVSDIAHGNVPAQSRSVTVSITVGDKLVINAQDTYETYKGASDGVNGAVNHYDGAYTSASTYTNVSYTFDVTGADTGFFSPTNGAQGTGKITWDPSKAVISPSVGQANYTGYKINTFKVTVTGTSSGVSATADKTISVKTWDSLIFTTNPTITSVGVVQGTDNYANDVTVSAAFAGAKKIIYNWGDGTSTSTNITLSETAKSYSAHHIYSVAGAYQVSITAVNDSGETTTSLLVTANGFGDAAPESDYTITVKDKTGANILGYFYVNEGQKLADVEFTPAEGVSFDAATQKLTALFENAAAGSAALGGKTADLCAVVTQNDIYYAEIVEKGFFDYHGWDFILFAVLAILSIVVYLYFYCHPAMPVLAIVFAILAVASYLCGGITEIIPALQAAWNSWFPPAQ